MKIEQLVDVFVKQVGARKDGPAYLVPDSIEATVFVSLASEVLQIPRVARLEAADGLVFLDTHKGDRFVVVAEHVSVVKIDRADGSKARGTAGFGK
jgi:hypothetical protein